MELSFQYIEDFHETIMGFCNCIYTSEGGTHLTGFKTAYTSLMNSYARELGISLKDIVRNVSRIRQVEHRLEVKKINGLTFIDDAFNSNPVGSSMALDVLSMMPERRVIVTPGMIDLGAKEDEINYEFGKKMLDKADLVVLVGEKQTKQILRGLTDSGFDAEKILVVKTVREAFRYIYANMNANDTILLENDLPDAFNV